MISSLSGTEPSLCFQELSISGSFDPPPVKIEVPKPSCSTPVLATAVPPPQLTEDQSSGGPAGLSEMSPSISKTLKILSVPAGGAGALRGTGIVGLIGADASAVDIIVFALVSAVRAMAHGPT